MDRAAHVQKVHDLLGEDAVLLQIPKGKKGPVAKGWQRITLEETQEADYQAQLAKGNIGVLLGGPSGGICAIDIDEDALIDEFLDLNPGLRQTLITRGKRGVQVWIRCKRDPEIEARGMDSWPKMYPLKFADRFEECGGSMPGEDKVPQKFGEWRADGGQSVIYGKHPDGPDYSFYNEAPVRELYFREICWPAGLVTPWEKDWLERLEETFGSPWMATFKESGEIKEIKAMCEPYWAGRFLYHNHLIYEADEDRFYLYSEESGCWNRIGEQELLVMLADMMLRISKEMKMPVLSAPKFRSSSKLSTVVNWLKGYASKRDIFEIKLGMVHLLNGMLDLTADQPTLKPFSPYYYSRNQIPVKYDGSAEAPKFMNDLLLRALPQEDVDLLQRWGGQLILQKNITQKFLIATGAAGAGKSTLLEVFQLMIGEENCEQLRTEQLLERFEVGSYVGATALFGSDVPGDFLMQKGSYVIKSLTGGDLIRGEVKGVRDKVSFRGDFNLGITCNSRLRLNLNADAAAWSRRLLIVPYECERPENPIPEFAKYLFRAEGPGILNWLIEGAIQVIQGDRLRLTDRQKDLVQDLLEESDSVRSFLGRRVRAERGADVTSDELVRSYVDFCNDRGWDPLPNRSVERALPDLMLEIFRTNRSNTINRNDKAQRGYQHIKLLSEEDLIDGE